VSENKSAGVKIAGKGTPALTPNPHWLSKLKSRAGGPSR
jgi:hypothetical protein